MAGAMNLERFLLPVFRPPLSLSVVAMALKYVATCAVLRDPQMLTNADRVRWQEPCGAFRKRIHLAALVVFIGLAINTMQHDAEAISRGLTQLPFTQCIHLIAMVVSFSPNTAAGAVGAFVLLVRSRRRDDPTFRSARIGLADCRLSTVIDTISFIFMLAFTAVYVLPLCFVLCFYGVLGMGAVGYACAYDVLTLPFSMSQAHSSEAWVIVPIAASALLSHCLALALIGGQAYLFEMRNPDLAQRIRAEGKKINLLKVKMPKHVPARILGRAQELATFNGWKDDEKLKITQEDLLARAPDSSPQAMDDTGEPALEEMMEKCILNDEVLAFIMFSKSCLCMALPFLQVCVVVAAKVYLGDGLWAAAQHTFNERSMAHYVEHIRERGVSGLAPLLWYYL
mmetsp:Transcript_58072/g.149507  ORF Transcript_58072/g.149507 Transcript_58072/m.149507 type:complete len:397 (-) Transcript_58072:6-1196(-)